MRSVILMAGLFLCGVFTMSDGTAQDKKPAPSDKTSYTEKVSVKKWTGAKFLDPVKDVPAFRGEIKGKDVYYTRPPAGNAESPKGSEITDKDGAVWLVGDSKKGDGYHINYVTKKEPEKKP